jgi:hypothetical protein
MNVYRIKGNVAMFEQAIDLNVGKGLQLNMISLRGRHRTFIGTG